MIKTIQVKASEFGNRIRLLREEKKLPLRTVAAYLDTDQAILSKIERGRRKAGREAVIRLAEYFNVNKEELMVLWLSDKLYSEVAEDHCALEVLQAAEEMVKYRSERKAGRKEIIASVVNELKKYEAIEKAWMFGSFARNEDHPGSDIDIALKTTDQFSYFDLAEVQFNLEARIRRKIDVGFLESFRLAVLNNIQPDLMLIYEKSA